MNHTCTKVTVRQRAIRNDRISLYLDYYPAVRNPETMQMSRREYLGIYLYAHPKNEMERAFNNEMLNKAEAIRCIRVQSLINEEFGFLDKTKQKADFLAYFKKMCCTKSLTQLIQSHKHLLPRRLKCPKPQFLITVFSRDILSHHIQYIFLIACFRHALFQ